MNSPVEKIKERLSIVDVLSSYLTLVPSGHNYKAKCPFHNEKTPSFFISPDRGTYYCFGCSARGDIFSFVEQFEGTDFLGALKLLAAQAGVSLDEIRKSSTENKDEKERLYEIMDEATTFFEGKFSQTPEARNYLRERGLTDETIKLFRIGYAPNSWRSVSDHLIKKGFDKVYLEKVGLVKSNDKGFYDRFRSRIMFPILDSSGRVIAFSGRIFSLSTDTKPEIEEAKYLNSPDTLLFNKSNVLFGIDKAKGAIRTRGYSIVVEGQLDLILSHQLKLSNTVAVSGTALAESTSDSKSKVNNLGLIRRLSPNIIFAYDGDEAGIRAASRSARIAMSLDMQVKIAIMPEGKDPADIISTSPDVYKEIIKNSINIVSFHIDRICQTSSDMRVCGRKIREIVFPFLSMVRSSIERSAYISEIHKKTGIAERAIVEDFESYEKANPTYSNDKNKMGNDEAKELPNENRRVNLERRLFGILFWQSVDGMPSLYIKEPYESFLLRIGNEKVQNMQSLHEPFKDTLAFEAEMWYGSKIDALGRDIKELLLNLEEEILQSEKILLYPLDTEEKLAQFNILSKRIEEIKQHRSL